MRLRFSIEERMRDSFVEMLEITIVEDDSPDTIEGLMPAKKVCSQALGVLHGGATISLAETVAGVGSNNICGEDEQCFGMQLSASHMSSAQIGDTVRAKARLQHKGRMSHVWDVDVISESTGKLISSVRVTNAVVKKRK